MINLSEDQIDIIKEIINLGVGKAASTLNTILGSHIKLSVPDIQLLDKDGLINVLKDDSIDNLASVNLSFKGDFTGSAKIIFPTDGASKLISAFAGDAEDEDDLNEIRVGTLSEIGNIVLNALMGTISNVLKQSFTYTPPNFLEGNINFILAQDRFNQESVSLLAKTNFKIESIEITGDFVLFFEVGSLDILLNRIDEYSENIGV